MSRGGSPAGIRGAVPDAVGGPPVTRSAGAKGNVSDDVVCDSDGAGGSDGFGENDGVCGSDVEELLDAALLTNVGVEVGGDGGDA